MDVEKRMRLLFVGCYSNSGICKLGICKNQGVWLGMGWSYLALQHRFLFSA